MLFSLSNEILYYDFPTYRKKSDRKPLFILLFLSIFLVIIIYLIFPGESKLLLLAFGIIIIYFIIEAIYYSRIEEPKQTLLWEGVRDKWSLYLWRFINISSNKGENVIF